MEHTAEIANLPQIFEQNAKVEVWYRLCHWAQQHFSTDWPTHVWVEQIEVDRWA